MADNQLKRVDRTEFNENDPFAELTRIMGSDPRGQAQPADDLGIDLEMELMGDFANSADFAAQPASAPRTAESWSRATDGAPEIQSEPASYAAPGEDPYQSSQPSVAGQHWDHHVGQDGYDESAGGDWSAAAAEPEAQSDVSASFHEDFDLSLDEELSSAFSDEPSSMPDEVPAASSVWHASQWAAVEDALAQPTWQDESPVADAPAADFQFAEQSGPVDMAAAPFADGELGGTEDVGAYHDEPVAYQSSPAPAAIAEDDWLADVDMDFTSVDGGVASDARPESYDVATDLQAGAPLAADAEQPAYDPALAEMGHWAPADAGRQVSAFSVAEHHSELHFEAQDTALEFEDMPQPMAPVARPQPSLEEELSALLGSDFAEEEPVASSSQAVFDQQAFQPQSVDPVQAEQTSSDEWHPSVHTFGYTDHRDELFGETEEPAAEYGAAEPAAHDDSSWRSQPGNVDEQQPSPQAGAGELAIDLDDEFAAIFADPDDDLPPAKPEPAFSGRAHAGASFHPVLSSSRHGREQAPEVETISVAENVVPPVGDIDIPDLNFEEEVVPRLYDDLEAEIAESFGDFGEQEPAQQQTGGTRQDWDPETVYAATAASAAGLAIAGAAGTAGGGNANVDSYGRGQDWQLDDNAWQNSFQDDLTSEFADQGYAADEALLSGGGVDDAASRPSRRRGLFVGAIVAGVVVVGGAGLFGASYFGGGSGEPVFISADADPMKVRPENPGGAVVPNQDNEVYQRVAGGEQRLAPTQEQLISSAEEPVDVAARSAVPLAPGVSSGSDAAAAPAGELAPKAEDRIEPARDEAGLATSEDFVAVQPRRVRTMVVRPDGTIVPREEVVEADALADVTTGTATAGLLDDVAGAAPLADPAMPDSVNVVPTNPAAEQQVAAVPAPSAPAAPPAQAEATPASAPAAAAPTGAATSEWSMQIASQPSAESAQATYQDLARRYGGVLEGRGVNIVRAEIEGKGVYYRVRIPASNRDEAIQLCTRYKSAGGSCFVSR